MPNFIRERSEGRLWSFMNTLGKIWLSSPVADRGRRRPASAGAGAAALNCAHDGARGPPGDKPADYARLAGSKGRSGVRPRREEIMKNDRRTFLKTAALAGAAATSGLGGLTTPAAARTGAAAARAGTQELP